MQNELIEMKTCYRGEERRSVQRDENDELNTYIREISSYPQLTFEQEQELWQKIEDGDLEAKQKLIQANLKLVVTIARKTIHMSGLPFVDLIQVI